MNHYFKKYIKDYQIIYVKCIYKHFGFWHNCIYPFDSRTRVHVGQWPLLEYIYRSLKCPLSFLQYVIHIYMTFVEINEVEA